MIKLLVLLLAALPAVAQITAGNHQSCRNGATAGCTTSAISTTGASLIVAFTGRSTPAGCVLSDSASNTWTALHTKSNNSISQAYYVLNPTTSGTHTFTLTPNADQWCGIAVQAFNSTGVLQALEQQSNYDGNYSASLTSIQPGSITPNSTTELFVTGGYMEEPTTAVSINSSFTASEILVAPGGSFVGVALGYRIPGAGTALNPAWSWSGVSRATSSMLVFAPVVSAPTISNLIAHASSSNGVVVEWDTTLPGDTQAKCGAVGGPYTYVSPILDPIGTGYSVTHHVAPVIGIPTSTVANSVGCIALSAVAGSGYTTSSETTTNTLAALTSASYRLIQRSAPIRYNDQFTGQNGMVANSRGTHSDTLWCTWAADGNEYCALNDGYGTFTAQTTLRNAAGYNTSIFKRVSGSAGLNITNIGKLTSNNETGPFNSQNYPSTYVADGGRPYIEGVISPGDRYGGIYFEQVRYWGGWSFVDTSKLCITLHKTVDSFGTIVESHNNNGPGALTVNFDTSNAGLMDYPRIQNDCYAKTFTNIWWLRHAKDYGGPWTGTGWTNTVTHAGGTDAWAYGISYAAIDAVSIKHVLVRYHRTLIAATRASDLQVFTGTGYVAADYADDSKWTTLALTNGTAVRSDIGNKCQMHFIPSPVNRFWTVCWTYNNTADGDSGMGFNIFDIGASPTSFNLAKFIGSVPIDKATFARYGPVFPELMLNTFVARADGTVSIRLSSTGNYRYSTTDTTTNYYAAFYEDLTFGPATSQFRPALSVGAARKQYPATGLKMFYAFDQVDTPNWSGGVPNLAGNGLYNLTPPAPLANGSWVASDLGGEFGIYGANPYGITQQLSTGYATSEGDFTVAILFEHNTQLQASPVIGECAFRNVANDLWLCRSGTSANTWIFNAKASPVSFSLTTDTGNNHLALLIARRSGSAVTIYQASGITSLPLTTLATATAAGALSGSTLYLGANAAASAALNGTIGAFTYHNVALSDAEISRAGNALLALAAARGAIVP